MALLTSVRPAAEVDVPELARTLTRAFLDDPVARWCAPSERVRRRMLERFYATRLRQMLLDEEVWTSADLAGAALWAPPGRWKTTPQEDAALSASMLQLRLLPRLPMVFAGMSRFDRRHPQTPPHWYLAVLGTDPEAQGRGIGSAVLAPVLERCDEDAVGAYLESSKERNIAFYARHGFRVTGEFQMPRGPRVWMMWRDPR